MAMGVLHRQVREGRGCRMRPQQSFCLQDGWAGNDETEGMMSQCLQQANHHLTGLTGKVGQDCLQENIVTRDGGVGSDSKRFGLD